MLGGLGRVGFGRCRFGQASSEYPPGYEVSVPADQATGISVYQQRIDQIIYCFSSYVDTDDIYIQVSEDGGGTYNDALVNGSFVAPYDGPYSKILRPDGQRIKVYFDKTSPWMDTQEIRFLNEGADEYGEDIDKPAPGELVKWD